MASLPLLQLPSQKAIIRVLRCMDGPELFLLSLLSRKTKFLVRCVQLKAPDFTVKIGSRISFVLLYGGMYIDFFPETMCIYSRPGVRYPYMELINNNLKLEEWLEHCQYIFNCSEARQLYFDSEFRNTFDLRFLKPLIGKFKQFSINLHPDRISVAQQILRVFLPDVKNLGLFRNPFLQGDTNYQKMLTQNFEELYLGSCNEFERFSLNDLLICNASSLYLSPNQDFKGINEFLKLWIKGANPRLRKLTIFQRTLLIPEDILKGIRIFKEIPAMETIVYGSLTIRGTIFKRRAVDIRRYDGTRGTIVMRDATFWFLVWD